MYFTYKTYKDINKKYNICLANRSDLMPLFN